MIQLFFIFTLITLGRCEDVDALKIYVFNAKQGDSQLLVFPSGFSVLIDLGESGGGHDIADYVGGRIEQILGKKEIDVFVMTHYHYDHQGVIGSNGIWYLVEKMGFTVRKFIDRSCGYFNGDNRDDCNQDNIEWHNVGQYWSDIPDWVCYGASTKDTTKLSKVREKAHRCTSDQISPPDKDAEIEVLMRDAKGVKDGNGEYFDGDRRSRSYPPAENDYSIALRVVFGDFVYSTCGDLSGKEFERDNGHIEFHDIESVVAPMMGEVDLYHANHHGLVTSTNQKWVDTLKPTVSVISCDEYVPDSGVMGRLTDAGSKIYTTNDCWDGSNNKYSDNTIMYGDDVVFTIPVGSDTFTVSKKDGSKADTYKIKKNKPARKCEVLG